MHAVQAVSLWVCACEAKKTFVHSSPIYLRLVMVLALVLLFFLSSPCQVVMPAGQTAQPPERFVVVDRGGEAAVLSLYSVNEATRAFST